MSGRAIAAGILVAVCALASRALAGDPSVGPPERLSADARGGWITLRQDAEGHKIYEGNGWSATVGFENELDAATPQADRLRREGFVFLDATTGESIREVRPGHFAIRHRLHDGHWRKTHFEVGSQTDAHLLLTLDATAEGIRYRYEVENRPTAEQQLEFLLLLVPKDIAVQTAASQWSRDVADDPLVPGVSHAWIPVGWFTFLPPGHTAPGLTFTTPYLPGVSQAIARGLPNDRELRLKEEPSVHTDEAISALYARNEVRRTVMAPAILPPHDAASRGDVVQWLLRDVDRAEAAGFIDAADAKRLWHALGVLRHATEDAAAIDATRALVDVLSSPTPTYRAALRLVLDAVNRSRYGGTPE